MKNLINHTDTIKCLLNISASRNWLTMVFYSKQTYLYMFSDDTGSICFRFSVVEKFKNVKGTDHFTVLKIDNFGQLSCNTYIGFHEGSFWYWEVPMTEKQGTT